MDYKMLLVALILVPMVYRGIKSNAEISKMMREVEANDENKQDAGGMLTPTAKRLFTIILFIFSAVLYFYAIKYYLK